MLTLWIDWHRVAGRAPIMIPTARVMTTMTSNGAVGARPRNAIDRRKAANVTCGLAALRRITLRKLGKDDRPGPPFYSKTDMVIATASGASSAREMPAAMQGKWAAARRSTIALDAGRRSRTIAEVEHGYIALRRTEPAPAPAPEAWSHELVVTVEPNRTHSVWALIGGIWLSTIVVAGGAVTAMIYLLG
jgi:hypothetical protein